jgi:hypothetical protein
MKVTESMVVFGHTLLAFDGWIPADAVGVVIEGKEHLEAMYAYRNTYGAK